MTLDHLAPTSTPDALSVPAQREPSDAIGEQPKRERDLPDYGRHVIEAAECLERMGAEGYNGYLNDRAERLALLLRELRGKLV